MPRHLLLSMTSESGSFPNRPAHSDEEDNRMNDVPFWLTWCGERSAERKPAVARVPEDVYGAPGGYLFQFHPAN